MLKQDFKKTLHDLYGAKPQPALIDVPKRSFVMIDGEGDPDAPGWTGAVEALYTVAYGVRFALKKAEIIEYPVMPMEGLWWTDEFSDRPEHLRRDEWKWTMMIPQPPQADTDLFAEAVATARRKKGDRAEFARLRFAEFTEGLSAQALHVGPYSTEPATHHKLMAFIKEHDKSLSGKHHEIYLSDPRRVEPVRLKTILRYGVI